ncbi:hypothetical protein [Acetobacter fabarum]|uniref:hypothetical protein n=1 Tax=Acetobacter fabarum TaxID=483199 RepID=UPI001178BBD8|nr:hypothetical protein [Acetobacter fabarum]
MDIDSEKQALKNRLALNKHCQTGLMAEHKVFFRNNGPQGSPELLALIYADDPFFGYWYGHIVRSKDGYASILSWMTIYVNAPFEQLLFRRYHYHAYIRQRYEPCYAQAPDDVFAHSASFSEALAKLHGIIEQFDIEKRWPDTPASDDHIDYRITDVYTSDYTGNTGDDYPLLPMQPGLFLAKTSP